MASLFDMNSSDSDSENDCDYVPQADEGNVSDDVSCDDSDPENLSKDAKSTKRKRRRKQQEVEDNEIDNTQNVKSDLTPEEEKKRADELWASFQKDVKPIPKRIVKPSAVVNSNESKAIDEIESSGSPVKSSKVVVTEVFDFAGEEVKVTKEVDTKTVETKQLVTMPTLLSQKSSITTVPSNNTVFKRPAKGLSAVLGALGKKPKLSTLQKSLHDWNSFKQDEGIEEELEHHNKGKEGFLEKQAFLQRSDLREFEIEKNIRNISRRKKS